MKSVNVMLMAAVLVLGLAVTASAKDSEEALHGPTVIVPEAQGGSRAIGDDCTNPIVISSLPYTDLGQTTCGRLNDYSTTCLGSYDGGEDIIYRLDLAAAAVVDIVMDPLGTTWTGITIDDVCPPDATCIATNTGRAGHPPAPGPGPGRGQLLHHGRHLAVAHLHPGFQLVGNCGHPPTRARPARPPSTAART